MTQNIFLWLQFLLYTAYIACKIPFQIIRVLRVLTPIVDDVEHTAGKIPRQVKNKALSFAVFLPLTITDPYIRLTQLPPNKTAALLIFALTAPYDHYMDTSKDDNSIKILTDIIKKPETEPTIKDPTLAYVQKLYIALLAQISPAQRANYMRILNDMHIAQMQSMRQKLQNPDQETLLEISKQKGGIAMLCYTGFLKNQTAEERKVLGMIGAWFQIADDYSDIENDTKQGIRTYFTETDKSIHKMILDKTAKQTLRDGFRLPYQGKLVERYLFEIYSALVLGFTHYERIRRGNRLVIWAHENGSFTTILAVLFGGFLSYKEFTKYFSQNLYALNTDSGRQT